VVVDDFNVVRVAILPVKANAPLIVGPDAILASTMTFELLESIAWRYPQIGQRIGGVQRYQLSKHCSQQDGRKSFNSLAVEQAFRISISEALDHVST
jgi:hypothetical protein